MEALENLVERVDRLSAMVETAVLEHAGAAAEAVARGVQTHAIMTISFSTAALALGVVVSWLLFRWGLRMQKHRDDTFDDTWMVPVAAGAVIAFAVLAGGGAFVGELPNAILEATDPVAAIAREAVMK